jgi:hypothetical protein
MGGRRQLAGASRLGPLKDRRELMAPDTGDV